MAHVCVILTHSELGMGLQNKSHNPKVICRNNINSQQYLTAQDWSSAGNQMDG